MISSVVVFKSGYQVHEYFSCNPSAEITIGYFM